MIVYKETKERFLIDVSNNEVAGLVKDKVGQYLNMNVGESEFKSWSNSLNFMYHVLNTEDIPNDSIIGIEYRIPSTNNRIDMIISGQNEENQDHIIIIELKQWSEVELTNKDAIVVTRFQQGLKECPHPSYQAWSYSTLLYGFNTTVYEENIRLKPCAYLHNLEDKTVINNSFYSHYLQKAPSFFKDQKADLQDFIKEFIKYGDKSDTILRIENGKIRPSKSLADKLSSMLRGNEEFIMIDDQKIVYEKALALAKSSDESNKNVLIVHGGPGTGKSVIAINLLVNLTKIGLLSQYVTKNAAPRTVYEAKLTDTFRRTEISNFFKGSGSYTETNSNMFDTLIVDESHRLNDKSGMFRNLGENQVKELINSSKFSVFFIDEDQLVTLRDIGTEDEIRKWANELNATVTVAELTSQFRCSGSDDYLSWLENTLQMGEQKESKFNSKNFDFQIMDDPNEIRDKIFSLNKLDNKARLVAGYCWKWISKKNPSLQDITIPEFDFAMRWNLGVDTNLWIINPDSVSEIGCIHTCQGLELEYIGVIVGPDLIVRNGKVFTDASKRSSDDSSIRGYKTMMKEDPKAAYDIISRIIKNTYRVLMTRATKGCYVYFTDEETAKYFKSKIGKY